MEMFINSVLSDTAEDGSVIRNDKLIDSRCSLSEKEGKVSKKFFASLAFLEIIHVGKDVSEALTS